MGWPTGQRRLDLPLKRSARYDPPAVLITALESCEPTKSGIKAALALYCAGRTASLRLEPGAAADQKNLLGWLASICDSVAGRVDHQVAVRVDTICVLVAQVLPRTAGLSAGSRELHILIRTATDYLPRTLEPYLSLPRTYRDRAPLAGEQTATEVLCGQLDLIAESVEDIRDAVLRADGDQVLANGRFLQDALGGLATVHQPRSRVRSGSACGQGTREPRQMQMRPTSTGSSRWAVGDSGR